MFKRWLENNNVSDYSFDTRLFEKAENRGIKFKINGDKAEIKLRKL